MRKVINIALVLQWIYYLCYYMMKFNSIEILSWDINPLSVCLEKWKAFLKQTLRDVVCALAFSLNIIEKIKGSWIGISIRKLQLHRKCHFPLCHHIWIKSHLFLIKFWIYFGFYLWFQTLANSIVLFKYPTTNKYIRNTSLKLCISLFEI